MSENTDTITVALKSCIERLEHHFSGPFGTLGDAFAIKEARDAVDVQSGRLSSAIEMDGHIDGSIVDLAFLRRAIEEGDPRTELLIRVNDMLRRSRTALSKARGE